MGHHPRRLVPQGLPVPVHQVLGEGEVEGEEEEERRESEGGEPHLNVREVFPLEGLGDEAGGLVLGDGLVNEEKAGEDEKKEE